MGRMNPKSDFPAKYSYLSIGVTLMVESVFLMRMPARVSCLGFR